MKRLFAAVLISCLITVVVVCQPPQSITKSRPLNMLVLGDSIMWGQGLESQNKSWYRVKQWLEKTTGRTVVARVEAHSGSIIEPGATDDGLRSDNREVNVARPTIHEQLDAAVKFYPDVSQVDLVLISGCGPDVGVENLLNASSDQDINEMTLRKCGAPMARLLHRIAASFPASIVVVTGYYPFFSERTRNDFVLQGLTKRFVKVIPGAQRKSSERILTQLSANSTSWYRASDRALAAVVAKMNNELGGQRDRVLFARIDFPPEYSFAAKQTRLWGFNRSPFRLMILFVTFGKKVLPANDEVRHERNASCNDLFRRRLAETAEQRQERHKRRMLCSYASLGHPNRQGAILYSDAIIAQLGTVRSSLGITTNSN